MTPPGYRNHLQTGVVHFGPGAFHRAHQAEYFHRLLHEDARWGIAAASLRSVDMIEALRSQDGLYTLAILDEQMSCRTIGAHSRFFGPADRTALRKQLLDPKVRIVTSTVTEKGYCLQRDGTLDFNHPDIVHDLARPATPVSLVGWLALGLADRRDNHLSPFVTICCDNMADNGQKLANALSAYAAKVDPELDRWVQGEVRFPSTMVDSITPATDERLRRLVIEKTGFDDRAPVAREPFAQWVVEDVLPADLPDLAFVGVTLTSSVGAWEAAKLRILNGSHSTLAYMGLLLGHETVCQAMGDARLSSFVERLVREDIIPTLEPSSIDFRRYADETFARFRNPGIEHRLSQIAWDGSQKLPYRLIDTIENARAGGRPLVRLVLPIAAWILFLDRQVRKGSALVDPLAERLTSCVLGPNPVPEILALGEVFPKALAEDPTFSRAVAQATTDMRARGVAAAIR